MKKFFVLSICVMLAFSVAGCSDSADETNFLPFINFQNGNDRSLDITFIPVEPESDSRTIFPGKGSVESDLGKYNESGKSKIKFTFKNMPKQEGDSYDYNVYEADTVFSSPNIKLVADAEIPAKFLPYIDDVDIYYHHYTENADFTVDENAIQLVGELKDVDLTKVKNVKLPVNYKYTESGKGKIEFTIKFETDKGWVPQTVKNEDVNNGQITTVYVWSLTENDSSATNPLFVLEGTPDDATGASLTKDITALKIGSNGSNFTELKSGYYRIAVDWKNYVMQDGTTINLESINIGDIVFLVVDNQTTKVELSPDFIPRAYSRNYFAVPESTADGSGLSIDTPCEFWSLVNKIITGKNTGNLSYCFDVMNIYGCETDLFDINKYRENYASLKTVFEKGDSIFQIKYLECGDTPAFYRNDKFDYGLKFTDTARIVDTGAGAADFASLTLALKDKDYFELNSDDLFKMELNPYSDVSSEKQLRIYIKKTISDVYDSGNGPFIVPSGVTDEVKIQKAFLKSKKDIGLSLSFWDEDLNGYAGPSASSPSTYGMYFTLEKLTKYVDGNTLYYWYLEDLL